MIHQLKIQSSFLNRLNSGEKVSEVRLNDRDFQAGDILAFDEAALWKEPDELEGEYRASEMKFKILHVQHLNDVPGYGAKSDFVVLSLKKTK